MKNEKKWFALGAALVGAALGIAIYRKNRDSYEQLPEEERTNENVFDEDDDFEPVMMEDDDFTYYVEDPDQIMFYE